MIMCPPFKVEAKEAKKGFAPDHRSHLNEVYKK